MAEGLGFTPETRMLIDGELVHAEGGKTYDNINPATEESIGVVADASSGDMHRAIKAARRAFDETDWSTNKELRKRGLRQLHDAIVEDKEQLRLELVAEVGTPIMVTNIAQLEGPLEDGVVLQRLHAVRLQRPQHGRQGDATGRDRREQGHVPDEAG